MEKHALTFDKLNITSEHWDIFYSDNEGGYRFSTPIDGVLLLNSTGKLSRKILAKQIQFINNYCIEISKRLLNYRVILLWDLTDVFNQRSISQVRRSLPDLAVDLVFIVTGKLTFRFYLQLGQLYQKRLYQKLFANKAEAIEFARQIKQENHNPVSKRFIELWTFEQNLCKVGRQNYRVLELPDWQYKNQENKLTARLCLFENRVLHVMLSGRINELDIHNLHKKLFEVAENLELDFKREPFYVVFDLKKVKSLSARGRKTLRQYANRSNKILSAVVVVGNSKTLFTFQLQKATSPERYDTWVAASTLEEAFALLEKIRLKGFETQKKERRKPADNYAALKKQYEELLKKHDRFVEETRKSHTSIRKVMSFINAGDFFSAPFYPRFEDQSIAGEVYNTLALLHADINKRKPLLNSPGKQLVFASSNVADIINNMSDPAFIYQDQKVLFVNKQFCEILGYQSFELEQQPISAIVNPFEINRVERQLEEIQGNNSISCDIHDALGNTIVSTLITRFVEVDGLAAQLVFFKPYHQEKLKGKADAHSADVYVKNTNQPFVLNRALAGIVLFHHAMIKNINTKLLNDYVSPSGFDHYKGIQALVWVSVFLKNSFEQYSLINTKNYTQTAFSPENIVQSLFPMLSDYLSLTKPEVQLIINESKKNSKLTVALNPFFVKAILLRLLHIVMDSTTGTFIKFGYQLNQEYLEFKIADSGTDLNLVSLNTPIDQYSSGLTVVEIESMLKKANGNLFINTESENGNTITVVIPVSKVGAGYEGSIVDLSNHEILVVCQPDEFEIVQKSLSVTHAKLVPVSNIYELQKQIENNHFKIILLDMETTEFNIKELVTFIRKKNNSTPIIGITNEGSHEAWSRFNKIGIDAFVTKPFDIEDFTKKITLLLA